LGYVDGSSLYEAYFVPDGIDPTGMSDENAPILNRLRNEWNDPNRGLGGQVWTGTKAFGYNALNLLSFGAFRRQDSLTGDRYVSESITAEQYRNATLINGAGSVVNAVVTIGTGGAGSGVAATGTTMLTRIAMNMAVGAGTAVLSNTVNELTEDGIRAVAPDCHARVADWADRYLYGNLRAAFMGAFLGGAFASAGEAVAYMNQMRLQQVANMIEESSVLRASNSGGRQTMATGREWYDHLAQKYGAKNVEWTSGAGRTVEWPSTLPIPPGQMFRVRPPARSPTFADELSEAAGPRPPGAHGHHNQPLFLNGVDNGAVNGSWQGGAGHAAGHGQLNPLIRLPYGTEIVPK